MPAPTAALATAGRGLGDGERVTVPFMAGRRIYVRGLERADLAAMVAWINDADVTRLLFTGDRPATVERLVEQWEQEVRSPRDVVFAVCTRPEDLFIGTTGLYGINWIPRTAEFRIFLGEKRLWNRGLGHEATRMMVAYGFDKLNLNRIWLGVNAENKGAVRVYEKAGFAREGLLRQEQYRNFRYYDVIRMALLRGEYEPMREGYLEGEEQLEQAPDRSAARAPGGTIQRADGRRARARPCR